MTEFYELFTPASVASSLLFGAMIGGLYGYSLAPGGQLIYPFTLWAVGLGFIVMLAIFTASMELSTTPAYSIARAVLWTIVCLAIPIGRWGRYRYALWRVGRRGKR